MKRFSIVLTVVLVASGTTLGSLYVWNSSKRPPVSLSEAIALGEKALGDEAKERYCLGGPLYGDRDRTGREGAWNLLFAAEDGSVKHVLVPMNGKAEVRPWDGPVLGRTLDEPPANLGEVERRIVELCRKRDIKAQFIHGPGTLTVEYNMRDYMVYANRDGEFEDELTRQSGPRVDGFCIRLQVVDKPSRQQPDDQPGPYWHSHVATYPLAKPNHFLAVEYQYGHAVKYALLTQLRQTFGR